jgi:hypothetical protein
LCDFRGRRILVGLKKKTQKNRHTDPNFEDHAIACSTMFLVPNIDQMYKEMKKIVEVRNKHGNGDEFPDFADLFFSSTITQSLAH